MKSYSTGCSALKYLIDPQVSLKTDSGDLTSNDTLAGDGLMYYRPSLGASGSVMVEGLVVLPPYELFLLYSTPPKINGWPEEEKGFRLDGMIQCG